jgi:hypothetical protein
MPARVATYPTVAEAENRSLVAPRLFEQKGAALVLDPGHLHEGEPQPIPVMDKAY